MMREILFRGKRKDNGMWIEGDYQHFCIGNDIYVYIGRWGEESRSVKPETVGQFTGLTDKNGKNIFEGDILKWDDIEWGSEHLEVVEWNYSLFSIRKDDWNEWCEVVGNIHDNPELIKNEHSEILR